jgi:hypothetical protein
LQSLKISRLLTGVLRRFGMTSSFDDRTAKARTLFCEESFADEHDIMTTSDAYDD